MGQRVDEDTFELSYPCRWQYRLIGRCEHAIRTAAAEAVDGHECVVEPSHRSRSGAYCSVVATVLVPDESTRTRIYLLLKNHADVMMVL